MTSNENGAHIPLNQLNRRQEETENPPGTPLNERLVIIGEAILRHRGRIIKTCSLILALVVITISILIVVSSYNDMTSGPVYMAYRSSFDGLCATNPCLNTGLKISASMRKTVNPCENFYEFTCGNQFKVEGVDRNTPTDNVNRILVSLINDILPGSPGYLIKLKDFYESCVSSNTFIWEIHERIDKIYFWPVLHKNKEWIEMGSDWTELIPELYKIGLKAHYFISVLFTSDPKNITKTVLRLDPPSFINGQQYLKDDLDSEVTKSNKIFFITNIFNQVLVSDDTREESGEIFNFEKELVKATKSHMASVNKTVIPMKIEELETKYPKINWLKFLNRILEPDMSLNSSQVIYVATPFIDKFYDLMTNNKPSNRILANYAAYRALATFPKYTDFVNLFGPRSFFFDPFTSDRAYDPIRQLECMREVNDYMYLAAGALYAKNVNTRHTTAKVKSMSEDIRKAFHDMIQKNDWLTQEMKEKTLRKITKTKFLIGYPNELLNNTLLDDYYKDLVIYNFTTYVPNILNYRKFELKKSIESLEKPRNMSSWTGELGRVTGIDAKFLPKNIVFIPAGMLQEPFYFKENPDYVNYAKIGFILGHEMAHILATEPRLTVEYDDMKKDHWDDESSKAYLNRTKCIVEKYNNYSKLYLDENSNGTISLDENIADIYGLKILYDAYIDDDKFTTESHLPGLTNYTNKQMFWITFGSSLCSYSGSVMYLTEENSKSHAPGNYRVTGAVSSLKEFADDFNCKPTDTMNPQEKCSIWF